VLPPVLSPRPSVPLLVLVHAVLSAALFCSFSYRMSLHVSVSLSLSLSLCMCGTQPALIMQPALLMRRPAVQSLLLAVGGAPRMMTVARVPVSCRSASSQQRSSLRNARHRLTPPSPSSQALDKHFQIKNEARAVESSASEMDQIPSSSVRCTVIDTHTPSFFPKTATRTRTPLPLMRRPVDTAGPFRSPQVWPCSL